jgi:hypothetical protein
MVSVSAVIGTVLVSCTSSSSNQALLLDDFPVNVAGPPPVAAALTLNDSGTEALSEPFTPLMVIVLVPGTVALPAVRVSVLLEVVEAGLNVAVTPAGKPFAERATLPVNPPAGVTVTIDWTLAP